MTSKGLRLLAYGRVSDVRGREGDAFISPEAQMERIRGYAQAYDHKIIEEGLDLDVSGGVMSRPVFDRFLSLIETKQADGLIVAKLDRFARSASGALTAVKVIEAAGGVLISVAEAIDSTTPAGKFLRLILLGAAEWEKDRIGEAWLTARKSAVSRGIHVSRHIPPGYDRLPRVKDAVDDRRLVPGEHAAAITKAFEMAARGESYARIATHLTARKVPIAGEVATWQPNRIKRLLANRVYLGEARSGSGNVLPHAHDPLVSEGTWTLAQRAPVGVALTQDTETLLAGLCRCAGCTFAMRAQKGHASVAVYRCTKNTKHGTCAQPSTISQKRLDDHVLGAFLAHAQITLTSSTDDEDDEAAQAAVDAEREYRRALTDVDLRSKIGADDHGHLVSALHDAWQEALASLPQAQPQPGRQTNIAELVAELQRSGDVHGLRELLGSTIQAVFVRPAESRARNLPVEDRVRIVWHGEERLELPKRGTSFEPRAYSF
jgi:site-specific DNA recombinase